MKSFLMYSKKELNEPNGSLTRSNVHLVTMNISFMNCLLRKSSNNLIKTIAGATKLFVFRLEMKSLQVNLIIFIQKYFLIGLTNEFIVTNKWNPNQPHLLNKYQINMGFSHFHMRCTYWHHIK